MIKGYMQGDLRNPIVHKYLKHSLPSWEPVSDVFEVRLVQCMLPNEKLVDDSGKVILDETSFNPDKKRSPQEIASIMSQYRMMKRISEGHSLWIMEHDAYLKPKGVDEMRRVFSKYHQLMTVCVGIAMECYTCQPEVASIFCKMVETDFDHPFRGPMQILHQATNRYAKKINNTRRNVWWPKKGQNNETGLSNNVSNAHNSPMLTIPNPVTQLVDESVGSTVTDRRGIKPKYTKESHPNFHFVTVDWHVDF